MSKIGNEARLIKKVLQERIDKEEARIRKEITDASYARGRAEGMNFVISQFHSIENELERGN